MHKKKEVIQDVTLHDLDVANARPQVSGVFVLFFICIIVGSSDSMVVLGSYISLIICVIRMFRLLSKDVMRASKLSPGSDSCDSGIQTFWLVS